MNSLSAQPQQTITPLEPIVMQHYTISEIDMAWLDREYRIFIAEPKQQERGQPINLVYLLDGNGLFPLALNALDWSKRNLPLIVGIGYPNDQAYSYKERTRDYTFAATGDAYREGGGSEEFYRFLAQQLKPYLHTHFVKEANARVKETLFGHSFGGLFSLTVALQHPQSFNEYVVASPSLWWGDAALLELLPGQLASKPNHILVTLGEYEENPERDPNITPERMQRLQQRKMAMRARDLVTYFQKQNVPSQFDLIPRQTHGGSIPGAINAMLRRVQNAQY